MEEKSVFIEFWGDRPLVRVLGFFLDNYLFDYSKTQIAKATGLSRVTVHPLVDKLEEVGVLKLNRVVGRAKMYLLNRKSPIVKRLMDLEDVILTKMEGKLKVLA